MIAALPLAAQELPPSAHGEQEEQDAESLVKTKDARVAMTATALFPGLGQLYNEEELKTLLVFVWESYYIAVILREAHLADFYRRKAASLAPGESYRGLDYAGLRARYHRHEDRQTDFIWYGSALMIASVLDAYVFANLYRHETDDIRRRKAGIRPLIDPGSGTVGLKLSWDF
jgi:hypothetical protein